MKRTIHIVTLFPEYFTPLMEAGVVGQALSNKRTTEDFEFVVHFLNPREFAKNNYKGVDDTPYGGGPGMVMRADILADTVNSIGPRESLHIVYTAPRGKVWDDADARAFADKFYNPAKEGKDLVFICGRYEGIDERFLQNYVDQFISLGDFVLSGGELAVMTILDSSVRFCSGALGNKSSGEEDSFHNGLLEFPQYTKPREFEGLEVPEVLTSGHHKKIMEYQKEQSIEMTKKFRPDLYKKYEEDNG